MKSENVKNWENYCFKLIDYFYEDHTVCNTTGQCTHNEELLDMVESGKVGPTEGLILYTMFYEICAYYKMVNINKEELKEKL